MPASLSPQVVQQYHALHRSMGWSDVSDRSQLEFRGGDRASFLNNFTTNDIAGLQAGWGREAFVTSVQGKILGHGCLFCTPHSLILETVPGQAEALAEHFDRYLIREDVEIADRTSDFGLLLVAGPAAGQWLADELGIAVPTEMLQHTTGQLAGQDVALRRVPYAGGDTFLLQCPRTALSAIAERVRSVVGPACDPTVWEICRIEAKWPAYGVDISDKNLPQEVNRDAQTINFQKGCYLGQETVARIDALGHVNRYLVALRFDGDQVPAPGLDLHRDDRAVGKITSACFSPRLQAPLALGYIRREHKRADVAFASAVGQAQIVDLGSDGPSAPEDRG